MNAHVITPLAQRQQALQAWLLAHTPLDATAIVARDPDQRDARLRIYADAYRLRLIEVLGNDVPVLRALLGSDAFDALALDYIAACPSRTPSVRGFGARLPDWLAARADIDPALASLARFEWAQGEVFDAPDAASCTIDALVVVAPESWPALRLQLHPAQRRLQLDANAAALVDAHARALPLPPLGATAPSHWLLWRQDFDVHWRRLDDDEAAALDAIDAGACFADWCVLLDGDVPALRAASLLKRWLADGLIAAIDADPLPSTR